MLINKAYPDSSCVVLLLCVIQQAISSDTTQQFIDRGISATFSSTREAFACPI